MHTFLGQAARQVFENNPLNELQQLQIIVPSRRAALYFKKELAGLSRIPFFSPSIHSIDDFIQSASGLNAIEDIELYFEIFEIWKKYDPEQPFEKFLVWVPTLVKDFNLIESSLLENPHLLFMYLSEAEALKRWNLKEDDLSDKSVNYFSFFDKMSAVFEDLKTVLLAKKMSLSGLAYRTVAESIDKLLTEQHYYFIGLNALSKAEEKIIESLVRAKKASCIWDSDDFYMLTGDKAGKKLRSYKKSGKYGSNWSIQGNSLLSTSKEIYVFKTDSVVLQNKLAINLIADSTYQSQALVVLNESDFPSLLVQLPSLDKKFNISAGMAFKASQLFTFLEAFTPILDFPDSIVRLDFLKTLLNGNIFRDILVLEVGEDKTALFYDSVFKLNQIKIDKKQIVRLLPESKLVAKLLEIDSISSFISTINYFLGYVQNDEGFAILLKEKLKAQFLSHENISVGAFKLLLKEAIKSISLPFEKETDAEIQVMSMLETRCLDFEEVTFVSFLEGNLPSAKKNNSFMPFDAAKEFNLPMYSDQDAIMSYHFFRLLQRAKKINIIYAKDSSGKVGRKEKSRFLHQIEQELVLKNPKIRIICPEISYNTDSESKAKEELLIEKTEAIQAKILTFLEKKGLSPTSISEFFKSELGFYWKYIEKIESKKKDSLNIGHDVFGSIIHYILETVEMPHFKKNELVTKEVLQEFKETALNNFETLLKENQPNFNFESGLNSILSLVAKELIAQYYDKRLREFKEPFMIVGLEGEFHVVLSIDDVKVKILGKVDKIEKHGNTIVVIDFKTGKVENKDIQFNAKTKSFEDFIQDPEKEKYRQLLIYYFLLNSKFGDNTNFEFKFYSFRNLDEDLILKFSNLDKQEILTSVEAMLVGIVKNLLDVKKPFSHDPEKKVKQYSDYYELLT